MNEPLFQHDFAHVVYDEPDYDLQIGIPELHKVRSKVEFQKRENCLPPDLVSKYADTSFWLRPGLNSRNVTII